MHRSSMDTILHKYFRISEHQLIALVTATFIVYIKLHHLDENIYAVISYFIRYNVIRSFICWFLTYLTSSFHRILSVRAAFCFNWSMRNEIPKMWHWKATHIKGSFQKVRMKIKFSKNMKSCRWQAVKLGVVHRHLKVL